MFEFAVSGWRSGLRGHSFRGIAILATALVGVAFLSASFSPRQPQAVALDIGFSALRFSLILMALFWIQELITREVERRTVNFTLAYPMPRSAYIVGRFIAVAALLLVATLVLGACLLAVVRYAADGYEQSRPVALGGAYWATLLALWLNVLVVTAFATAIAAISTVSILPLALGIAFSLIAQTLGPVMDFLLVREGEGIEGLAERYSPIIDALRWIVPDLSRLDWRAWPMYGMPIEADAMTWSISMAVGYCMLMLGVAVFSFNRREFT